MLDFYRGQKAKMKIAVFHNLPPGGAKRVLGEEVKFLSKKHEITAFKYDYKIKRRLPSFLDRLDQDFQSLFILRKLHKKLAEKINQGGFEICLVHPDKLTQAPFLLRYLRVPSLYCCEELLRIAYEKELEFKDRVIFFKKWYEDMTRILRKKIDKNNAQAATKIFVGSNYIKEKVNKAYGKKAKTCPFGVDVKIFLPKGFKKEKTLLFIGGKEKVPGFYFAQKCIRLIPKSIRPNLKVISFSKNKLRLSDDELAAEYSRAFATLCTSYNEPFGLVPLESMASGTPVLAVNDGGYKETIIDGETGFLLKRDPEEFAEKIIYLIEHPEVVERMGKAGRQHVIKNFSWKKHVQLLEQELRKLAK